MLLHFKRFHPEKQETRQSIIMIYDYVWFLSKENKNTIGTVKEGVFLSKKSPNTKDTKTSLTHFFYLYEDAILLFWNSLSQSSVVYNGNNANLLLNRAPPTMTMSLLIQFTSILLCNHSQLFLLRINKSESRSSLLQLWNVVQI